ncbi:MAG: energy-coupling factor ABC transporter permease [Gammaproteobacteria bacterium]|jgi:uncharacterized membrane protein
MNITPDQVFGDFRLLDDTIYVVVLAQAVRLAPWRRLLHSEQLNMYLISIGALVALWSLRAGVEPGLDLHYLGLTALTLVFGWQLAVIAGTAALLVQGWLFSDLHWSVFSVNALITMVVPVAVTYALYRLADRKLPNHFAVYIFFTVFFNAIIAILLSTLLFTGLLLINNAYPLHTLVRDYLAYLPLVLLPEALLNGMIMTVVVVLKPQWVACFDRERYLDAN